MYIESLWPRPLTQDQRFQYYTVRASVVSNRLAKTGSNRCIHSLEFCSQAGHTHIQTHCCENITLLLFRGGVNIGKNEIMCYELNLFVSCGCGVYVLVYFIYGSFSEFHLVIKINKIIYFDTVSLVFNLFSSSFHCLR